MANEKFQFQSPKVIHLPCKQETQACSWEEKGQQLNGFLHDYSFHQSLAEIAQNGGTSNFSKHIFSLPTLISFKHDKLRQFLSQERIQV